MEESSLTVEAAKLKQGLEAADFGDTLDVGDFNAFQARLELLYTKYSRQPLAKLVTDHLAPQLDHIRSFERAISMSAQQSSATGYVWSAVLAIIECTCRHVDVMSQTFEQMAEFYKDFPIFEAYIDLFPQNEKIRFILEDLYQIYAEFSLYTIRYMGRGTFRHIASNFISSKTRRNLSSIRKSWQVAKVDFENAVTLAYRSGTLPPGPRNHSGLATRKTTTRKTTNMLKLHRYFVGRDKILDSMNRSLASPAWKARSAPKSCLIHGMGGMGKTQVALGYNYRYESLYQYRFWVEAENPTKLSASFDGIAAMLGLTQQIPGQASPSSINAVRDWMESAPYTWLLVFDNVEPESVESVEMAWPVTAMKASAIIVTSQLEQLKHRTDYAENLESLSVDDGARLLLKCLGRDPDKVSPAEEKLINEVSDMLGGHPLALAHIGGYISESTHNLAYFKDFFNDKWQRYAWKGKTLVEVYEKKLEIVWDLALKELPEKAHKLINIMSYLNSDGIREEWLTQGVFEAPDWGLPSSSSRIELVEMTRSLGKRCLISSESKTTDDGQEQTSYSVHKSLQMALRIKLDQDLVSRDIIFTYALSILERVSPTATKLQIPDPRFWPQFQVTNPHVLSLCSAFRKSDPPIQGTIALAKLFYSAGFHVWERWNPSTRDGTDLLETAENILDSLKYKEDKLRADISCMLSLLLDILGPSKWPESLNRRKEIWKIRKSLMNDPDVSEKAACPPVPENEHLFYNAANDLALSHLQINEFKQAEELFEECFTKYKQWGREDELPFEYAKYYHNIAIVRMYEGRYDEAIEMAERGSMIKKRTDGARSSRYLWFQYDLACILLQAGHCESALELHEEVLKGREEICGPKVEVTLQSLYTVGAMFYHLGEFSQAEYYFRDCIDRAKKARWHDYASARAQYHLALVLRGRERDKAEEEQLQQLERTSRSVLDQLFRTGRPKYLTGVTDEISLFDSMQPIFEGRWTGRGLLPLIQTMNGVRLGRDGATS